MEIHPIYVPFPRIVLCIHIHLSTQPFAKGKMPSPLTTHPRARSKHSEGSAAHGSSRTASGSGSAGRGARHQSLLPHACHGQALGRKRGKEQRHQSRQGTPAAQPISAGDFPACTGPLDLLFMAQVSPSPASRGWMSPLLPGAPEQYPQPCPRQPSLQLWRLSFPQAATTRKATLAEHPALFPSLASPLKSQPQEITNASKRALCLSVPRLGAVHKKASCRGCEH